MAITLERTNDNVVLVSEMRNLSLYGEPAAAQSDVQKGMGWKVEGWSKTLRWGYISLVQRDAYAPNMAPRPGVAGTPNPNFKNLGYRACVAVVPSIHASSSSSGQFYNDKQNAVHVQRAHALDIIVAGATRFSRGNGSATNLLPVAEVEQRCLGALERALRRGFAAVEAAHVEEHREKFQRTFVEAHSADVNATSEACAATLTTPERVARYKRTCFPSSAGNTSAPIPVTDVSLQTLFFALGKYLLLGSSRTGTQPANLVGIWAEGRESPWNGDYHMNINLQMMYWAVESLQLAESAEPLVAFTHELARSGASTASCMYGMPGWVSHGFTDIWMKTRALGDPQWAMCVTCGAWVSLHLLEAFRFRQDSAALVRDVLPILAGAVEFFLSYLTPQGPDSSLLTGPTHSPENSYGLQGKFWPLAMSPAIDTAILYELFSGYVDGCAAAQCEAETSPECAGARCRELSARAQQTLAKLPNKGFPIVSANGHFEEYLRWGPFAAHTMPDWGHRHWSPLFSLFPGNQIQRHETPALAAAAEATVKRKMDANGAHTGWSAAWAGALYARLGNGAGVQRMLDRLLGRFAMGNLLSTHPPLQSSVNDCSTCVNEAPLPNDQRYWGEKGGASENFIANDNSKFQLDGNLGALALVTEALLQSRDRRCTCTRKPVAWAQASSPLAASPNGRTGTASPAAAAVPAAAAQAAAPAVASAASTQPHAPPAQMRAESASPATASSLSSSALPASVSASSSSSSASSSSSSASPASASASSSSSSASPASAPASAGSVAARAPDATPPPGSAAAVAIELAAAAMASTQSRSAPSSSSLPHDDTKREAVAWRPSSTAMQNMSAPSSHAGSPTAVPILEMEVPAPPLDASVNVSSVALAANLSRPALASAAVVQGPGARRNMATAHNASGSDGDAGVASSRLYWSDASRLSLVRRLLAPSSLVISPLVSRVCLFLYLYRVFAYSCALAPMLVYLCSCILLLGYGLTCECDVCADARNTATGLTNW